MKKLSILYLFVRSIFFLGIGGILITGGGIHAQTSQNSSIDSFWSLQQCIQRAVEHNLRVKQNEVDVQSSQAEYLQSRLSLLPNFSGSLSHAYQFGRSIDPTTNDFVTNTIQTNAFSVDANVTLFDGLRKQNTIQQNKYQVRANRSRKESTINEVTLSVVNQYLQILSQRQQVRIARQQLQTSQQQVERMEKLVEAGRKAKGELFELQSQKAQEEYNLQTAQNQLSVAYTELQILLKLPTLTSFRIKDPDLNMTTKSMFLDTQTIQNIYQQAVQDYPTVRQARFQKMRAAKSIAVAQSRYTPSLSLFGSVGTNYSSFRKEVVGQEVTGVDTIGFVSNTGTVVQRPTYDIEQQTIPFQQQLEENLNEQVGVRLQIPIFQGWQHHIRVDQSRLEYLKSQYALEEAKDQLKQDIQRAYTQAKAAQKNYQAAQKNVQSAQKSFEYARSRLETGAATSFDYRSAKNRLAQAQSQLIQAKYEYVFRLKILEFYQGQPMQLGQ